MVDHLVFGRREPSETLLILLGIANFCAVHSGPSEELERACAHHNGKDRYLCVIVYALDLGNLPGWELKPNFHLAFPYARPRYRWYPRRHCSGAQYMRQWISDVQAHRAGGRSLTSVMDDSFWQWLVDRRYADSGDRAGFEAWLEKQPTKRQIHIRPGIRIRRTWKLSEASMLDSRDELVPQVDQSIKDALTALGDVAADGQHLSRHLIQEDSADAPSRVLPPDG